MAMHTEVLRRVSVGSLTMLGLLILGHALAMLELPQDSDRVPLADLIGAGVAHILWAALILWSALLVMRGRRVGVAATLVSILALQAFVVSMVFIGMRWNHLGGPVAKGVELAFGLCLLLALFSTWSVFVRTRSWRHGRSE